MRRAGALGAALAVMLGLFCLCRVPSEHHWTKAETDKLIQDTLREEARDAERARLQAAQQQRRTAWHPPLVTAKKIQPALRLKRGPNMKRKGKIMATWTATGASDNTYDGVYVESGVYPDPGGAPKYTNGSRWLWYDEVSMTWGMSATAPGVGVMWVYETTGATLPDVWHAIISNGGSEPAPTVAAQTAWIRIGSSEADAVLWDSATEHRFSKYGSDHGGYKDVSTATTGQFRTVPFQYQAPARVGGLTYQAVLKLNGHTWQTVTGLLGGDEVKSGAFTSLPYSTGPEDPWDGYLAEAGAKTITVELQEV